MVISAHKFAHNLRKNKPDEGNEQNFFVMQTSQKPYLWIPCTDRGEICFSDQWKADC